MMKRMLAVMSVVALLATSASALPGPNSMGVFVDNVPTTTVGPRCVTKASGPIDFYLCLMNPEVPAPAPTQVAAYEVVLNVPGGNQLFGNWDLQGGINVGEVTDWGNVQLFVGTGGNPLTPDENNVILLAHWSGIMTGMAPIAFQIRGNPPTQSFPETKGFGYAADENTLVECTAMTGQSFDSDWGAVSSNWVLVINNDGTYDTFCNAPVGDVDTTWSSLKGLYR